MQNGQGGKRKMDVKFIDNSEEIKDNMKNARLRALEKVGMTAEKYAKRLCPVDTGNLRNSITHRVDQEEPAVYVGSDSEYAAYVELGTGKHYPGGRPTPWAYQDAKGNWHWTAGNKAQPYLKPAAENYAAQYRKIVEDEMKNG